MYTGDDFNYSEIICVMMNYISYWVYSILNIVGYLMPNHLHTYISNMYDLVWFGFMEYQLLLII